MFQIDDRFVTTMSELVEKLKALQELGISSVIVEFTGGGNYWIKVHKK